MLELIPQTVQRVAHGVERRMGRVLVGAIGFAALAAIPNQGSFSFINIPLLHGMSTLSLP